LFPAINHRLVNLLPLQPKALGPGFSEAYRSGYKEEFKRPFLYSEDALAWGAPETVPKQWARIRNREASFVLGLLGDQPRAAVVCDFSGGAGYYTLKYAHHFSLVLHCDLSVASLSYVERKATALGLSNVYLLRIDYFNPPFLNSLPRVICMDTLIRGAEHEGLVLRQLSRSLAPGGKAVVDFHNWWHNPLRRMGLLPNHFRENRSYWKPEADDLFRQVGIEAVSYAGFHQEADPERPFTNLLRHVIPPTRLVYQFTKESGLPSGHEHSSISDWRQRFHVAGVQSKR
jgi:SAM-dependent methyltransferase